jgi:hypothetical protein
VREEGSTAAGGAAGLNNQRLPAWWAGAMAEGTRKARPRRGVVEGLEGKLQGSPATGGGAGLNRL